MICVTATSSSSSFVMALAVSTSTPFLLSSATWSSAHGDMLPMRDEESPSLAPGRGFSSSSFGPQAAFASPLRVFSSFSELGSEEEEEEDDEDDEEDEEEDEEHDECAVLLLWGFSESLLSERSEVKSVLSLFRPAFLSSSSPFRRLFTDCLAFDFKSEK